MRKFLTSTRILNLKTVLVTLLICSYSLTVLGQCDVLNSLTVPQQYFNTGYTGNGNFNAIVFGDYNTSDGQTGGRLAVGGDLINSNVSDTYDIGLDAASPTGSDNLIVNAELVNVSGGTINVQGNAKYGSLSGAAPTHSTGGANSVASGLIDYPELLQHYTELSETYESTAQTPTATVTIGTNGEITLTGNNTVQNYVFNVTLTIPLITEINFVNIPVGSNILINILNANSINISPEDGSSPMVTTYRDNTLFNFPNAENILIDGFDFQGSVLMPVVETIAVTDGDITGVCIIGGTVTQATNFNILNSCLSTPLPVTLAKFTAQKEGNTALLTWQTTSDVNATKFVVERSQGKNKKWLAIGEREIQVSNALAKSYTFTDASPMSKTNLYRLKMEDKDGSFSYSRLEEVYFENTDGIKAYPNPATEMVSITTDNGMKIQSVTATNLTGREYPAKLVGGTSVEIKSWPAGIYLLKLTTDDGVVTTKKVIKN